MIKEAHQKLAEKFTQCSYIADGDLISSVFLMEALQKPLLLEGEAGVGKTEVAKILASCEGAKLIRLQCFEGLDAHQALYEWDHARQLMAIQMQSLNADKDSVNNEALRQSIYSEEYLLKRPLLAAISETKPVVLLIDELDRADEAFEALLLEVLSDFQVSIPEFGTIKAQQIPKIIITANGVRELSDALRRRCLYHYIDYPTAEKELAIIQAKLPELSESLARQVVQFVQNLRQQVLRKTPGIAETLDWAQALEKLGVIDLSESPELLSNSLTTLLKTREDIAYVMQMQGSNRLETETANLQ